MNVERRTLNDEHERGMMGHPGGWYGPNGETPPSPAAVRRAGEELERNRRHFEAWLSGIRRQWFRDGEVTLGWEKWAFLDPAKKVDDHEKHEGHERERERRMANELQNLTADGVPVRPGDNVFEVCPDGIAARRVIRDGGIVVAVDLGAHDLRSAESGLCDIAKCYWLEENAEIELERTKGKCGKGTHVYGTCPICGAPGVHRERRVNGNDCCEGGHVYPSRDALTGNKTPDPTAESVRKVVGFATRDLKAGERIAIAVYPDRLESCAIDFRLPDTQTPSNVTADGVQVYPGDVVWEPWPRGSRPYEVRTFDGRYFDAVRDDGNNGVERAEIAHCYSTLAAADAAEENRPRAARLPAGADR